MDEIVSGRALKGQALKQLQSSSAATLHDPTPLHQTPAPLPLRSHDKPNPDHEVKDSSNTQLQSQQIKSVKPGGMIDYSVWEQLKDEEDEKDLPLVASDKSASAKTSHATRAASSSPFERETLQLIENIKQQGNSAFKKEDYKAAIERYTEAIQTCLQPSLKDRENDDPFSFLDKLIKPDSIPVPSSLYLNRALSYYRLGEFEKGLNDCNSVLSLSSTDVKALYRKYQCLRGLCYFEEAKNTVEECLALTENSKENQQVVSLTILQSCHRQVALLVQDGKDATSAKSQTSSIHGEVRQIMDRMHADDPKTRSAAHGEMAIMFASTPECLHIFREFDGFRVITSTDGRSNTPTISWAMLLASACEGTPENARALSECVAPFIEILLDAQDLGNKENCLVLDSMLQLVFKNDSLRLALETLGSHSCTKFQYLLLLCLKETPFSSGLKSLLLEWLSSILKEGRLKFFSTIVDSLLLTEATRMVLLFLSAEQPLLVKEAVSFLFYLSLNKEAAAKKCLDPMSSQIFESLVQVSLKHSATKNQLHEIILSDVLSTIYNILLISNSMNEKSVDVSFISFLCAYSSNSTISIKLLAKLTRVDSKKFASTIAEKLDWSVGMGLFNASEKAKLEDAGDWSQVLAAVLNSNSKVYCLQFEGLLLLLISLMKNIDNQSKEMSRLIGNTTLCLLEFASMGKMCDYKSYSFNLDFLSLERYRDKMIDNGLMETVILHLRSSSNASHANKSLQRNLAICCAKLCQNAKGLIIARSMDAIPLIYSLKAV